MSFLMLYRKEEVFLSGGEKGYDIVRSSTRGGEVLIGEKEGRKESRIDWGTDFTL